MPSKKNLYVVALLILILLGLTKVGYEIYISKKPDLEIKQVMKSEEPELNTIAQYRETLENEEVVATLTIEGADIDVVVVQSSDNDYYLTHTAKKEKNKYGAIFLDYRNNIGDKKLVIYGHSSTIVKPPFTNLMKYTKKTFYENNKYITFKTDEGISTYIIFSVMINEKGNHRHTALGFDEQEWEDHIRWMNENRFYDTGVKASVDDEILTLQTCYYSPKNSYLVVNAKKMKKGE